MISSYLLCVYIVLHSFVLKIDIKLILMLGYLIQICIVKDIFVIYELYIYMYEF